MAGILDQIFGGSAFPASAGFAPFDAARAADERLAAEAEAQAAREAAAARLARSIKRPFGSGAPDIAGLLNLGTGTQGGSDAFGIGGLLNQPQTALETATSPEFANVQASPPPTNDPSAAEPKPYANGKPIDLGTQAGTGEAIPAPMSLAPSAQFPAGDGTDLPPSAKPAIGAAMPAQGSSFGSDLISKIMDPSGAPTLLALAGGFAGAPSIGTGMRRGFSAAVAPAALQERQQREQMTQREVVQALIGRGASPQEAFAAARSPELLKQLADKYFPAKPLVPHEIGQDLSGNKIMGSFNPNTGKWYDTAGREITPPGGAGGAGGKGTSGGFLSPTGDALLAKGVQGYNPELIGEEYLAQFSPEVKAAIQSYIRGDTQPTGNPRMKGMATKVKEWATKYGADVGIPVSDATYSERRKYRTELGTNSPNSAGGQAKAFNQGIEHASALADKLEALGNVDPVGIPAVAAGINWARQAFSSKQTGIAKEAANIGQTLAGEVGKLFSGAAGGGVHERELTRQRFNTITTPYELAGALESTLETMEGGLRALEQRRDSIMGPNSDVQLVADSTRGKIAKIRETISRLKGEAPAKDEIPAIKGGKTKSGLSWSIQ